MGVEPRRKNGFHVCGTIRRMEPDNMRMRRHHAIEVARYFQRLENIEKRKLENERQTKNNFMVRFIRRLGLLRNDSDRLV